MKKTMLLLSLMGLIKTIAFNQATITATSNPVNPKISTYLGVQFNFFEQEVLIDRTWVFNESVSIAYDRSNSNLANLGFSFKKEMANSWFWEAGVHRFSIRTTDNTAITLRQFDLISEPTGGIKEQVWTIGTRLSLFKALEKLSTDKVRAILGFNVEPELIHINHTPQTSAFFPYKIWHTSASLHVLPGLMYQITDQISLDLKIPFQIGGFYYDRMFLAHPTLQGNERIQEQLRWDWDWDQFQVALAIFTEF